MIIDTPQQHENYLRRVVIDPPGKMLEAGFTMQAVLLMAQSFEIYGAYFDNKPFRSTGQSLKRFDLAIANLFGYKYHLANRNNELYTQMRALFIHTFLPGERLHIIEKADVDLHLNIENGIITIIPAVLNTDVRRAGTMLIKKLHDASVSPKRVSTSLTIS
ncbi:MAG: hypothetical protein KA793_01585 [Bacteroidales bacterium]|nr:hypothetical protein [Bacteroidales bacterium]